MIGNRFYTWFKNYYQWVGGAFNETLLLPLVRATAGLRAGAIRYDETTNTVETYDGTNWNAIPSASGFVPYTGATQDVNLGEQGLEAGYLQLDTTPTGTPTDQGTIYWDIDAETAALIMNGTVQKVGEDVFFHVQNKTGSPIPKGTCVRFAGTDGNSGKLLIAPFLANGTYPSQYFMGVTSETIANGAFGKVYHFGKIRGVNTQAYNAGDILYASTTIAGGFQTTPPIAPNNIIVVAAVISKANNGTLMIRSTLGSNINNDEGVLISGAANSQGLFYENGLWKNKTIATVLGYTPGTVSSVGIVTGSTGTDINVSNSPVTVSGNITLNIPTASATNRGALSSSDWTTFNNKVGTSRQLTINGTAFDLSADRTWSVGTVTSVGLNTGSAGTDINVSGSPVSVSGNITLNIPDASTTARGVITTGSQTIGGVKTFNNEPFFSQGIRINDGNSILFGNFSTLISGSAISKELVFTTDSTLRASITNNGLTLNTLNAATSNTNSILVSDGGLIRSRTASQILSDISAVPTSRTITINGTALDLSTNRSWSVGTVTSVGLTSSTSGVTITDSPVTVSGTIGIAIATANGSQQGLLSSTDWTTFNNKQNTLSLTTTGTSGAATLIGATLNVPQYQAQGNYITSLTGEATASGPGAASVTLSTTAVTSKLLTGLNLSGGGTIAATDSILQAFGKVQNQISAMVGGVMYQGTWNASTNTPTLTSSVGVKGNYYIVDVSGTTNLNGITDWRVGDWAIFNGSTWDKVDNTDAVSSVNGFTGAVSLTTSHIAEGTNLYYLDSRSRTAISLTTTGNSGAATYDNVSGIINVPQYTLAGLGGVPTTRQLTINGTAFDLSADRSWNVGTVTSVGLNSTTSGVTITNTPVTSSGALTINIATASSSQNGLLSSTDWTTFNNKQNALTNPVTGTGVSGQIAYFNGTNSVTGESNLFWDAANDRLGIGNNNPQRRLEVAGSAVFTGTGYDGTSAEIQLNNTTAGTGRNFVLNSFNGGGFQIADKTAGGATRLTLDASGNLGLSVTPSAWTVGNAFEIGFNGNSIWGATANNLQIMAGVAYANNQYEYRVTGAAVTNYRQTSGSHQWFTGPSGTSGQQITFTQAMTLTSSSKLLVNTETDNGNYIIQANGNIASINSSAAGLFTVSGTRSFAIQSFGGDWNYLRSNGAPLVFGTQDANDIYIRTNDTNRVTIAASTGAATFSSSVTAGGSIQSNITKSGTGIENVNFLQLRLFGTNAIGDSLDIRYLNNNGNNIANISAILGGDNVAYGSLAFSTRNYFTDSMVEVMRINNRGNVGIGTATPENASGYATMTINGSSGGQITFATTNSKKGYLYNNATNMYIGAESGALIFDAGAIERMRITSGGLVGIGTNSPQALLHINSSVSHTFAYSTISGASPIALDNSSGALAIWTASTERMRITSGGNVLVGTTTDAGNFRLQVSGAIYSAGQTYLSGTGYNASSSPTLYLNNTTASTGRTFGINSMDSGGLQIFDATALDATRLIITASGNTELTGSIKTGAPSGGTAQPWKLGTVATVSPTSPNRTIEVEVNGVTYYLHAKTTNN